MSSSEATMPEEMDTAQTEESPEQEAAPVAEVMDADELLGGDEPSEGEPVSAEDANLKAVVEAVIYVTEEPLTLDQIAAALELPKERVAAALEELIGDYTRPERGIAVREVAGGYKMGTKPEHHEAIRSFVKKLKPPLKLSLAALETLAVIAYKQPITAPEIQEVRGVQGAGVLKTLIDRKLITPAGRKNVVGKPILYKTTKEFLLQFGLRDLAELPTLKEFEELRRLAFPDEEEAPVQEAAPSPAPAAEAPADETLAAEVPADETPADEQTAEASADAPAEAPVEAPEEAPEEAPAEPAAEPPQETEPPEQA